MLKENAEGGGSMTGRRGYQCSDGPLIGGVVMVTEDTETGTLWNVEGPEGSIHVYEFRGDHFRHCVPAVGESIDPAYLWGRS